MNVFKNLASLAGGLVGHRAAPTQNQPGWSVTAPSQMAGSNPWWMPTPMSAEAKAVQAAASHPSPDQATGEVNQWWMPATPGLMPAPAQGIGWGQSPDVVNAPIDAGAWPGGGSNGFTDWQRHEQVLNRGATGVDENGMPLSNATGQPWWMPH